jgi:hypothetical protein
MLVEPSNMTCFHDSHNDARRDFCRLVVLQRLIERLQALDILLVVKRLDRFFPLPLTAAILSFHVRLLQVRRILENQLSHINRRGRGINRTVVVSPSQQQQATCMVEVCVSQDDRVQILECALLWQAVVVFRFASALKQPAID